MKKIILTVLSVATLSLSLLAQEAPKGKVTGKIFSNYHFQLNQSNANQGFELQRAYLGYSYKISDLFSTKVVLDMGNPSNGSKLERTAYVKNALVNFKKDNLSINFGLIGTTAFKVQEKFWGNRYLFKSFQDQNKFNTSADMGISASYKLAKGLSVDASITNGEGYKKLQQDNSYRYGVGLTYKMSDFTFRAYADMYQKDDNIGPDLENQNTVALFAGYKHDIFSIGAEYNMLSNYKFADKKNMNGFSIYSTVNISKKLNVFGRFDGLSSKDDWNTKMDGNTIIAGLEFNPVKYVTISPNIQLFNPKADGADNISMAYLSVQIKF